MRRASVIVLTISLCLSVGGAQAVLAQGPPAVGTEVPYVDAEGVTRGSVVIREIADPFTGFAPDRGPAEGTRYVDLTVVFTAADDQTLEAQPYHVVLRDTDGYLYQPSYVPRPEDVTIPVLEGQTMAPGNRISGAIGYSVPETAVIDEVLYLPGSYRAIRLADLVAGPGAAVGTEVPFTDEDGSAALLTAKLADPFTEADPDRPPEAGSRYAALTFIFDNVGELPFAADPYEVQLLDADGHVYTTTYVPRPADAIIPDLEAQTMAPGNRVSGFVGFVVPENATLAAVMLQPGPNRWVTVADLLGGGEVLPPASPGPVATPAPPPSVVPVTPEPSAGTAQ